MRKAKYEEWKNENTLKKVLKKWNNAEISIWLIIKKRKNSLWWCWNEWKLKLNNEKFHIIKYIKDEIKKMWD